MISSISNSTNQPFEWRTTTFSTAAGLFAGFVFYLIIDRLINHYGPQSWEHSALLTFCYAAIIAFAGLAPLPSRPDRYQTLTRLVASGLFGAACSLPTAMGPMTGCLLGIAVAGLSLLVRRLSKVTDSQESFATLSLSESFAVWAILTTTVGCLWTLKSSSYYSDEFVVLAWILLGLFNLLIIACAIIFQGLIVRVNHLPYLPALLLSGIISLCGLCASGSIFFRIWAQGDDAPDLGPVRTWANAFQPLPIPAINNSLTLSRSNFGKQDLVALLEKQNSQSLSHVATLFFLTHDPTWAMKFRKIILNEASTGKYIKSGGSIKFGQRDAMTAAMFYLELRAALPTLFSASDAAQLNQWFSRITQAMLTPGWVDWLYAIPMRVHPEGPYLNQEIGAGALAAMQQVLIASNPDLATRASGYVSRRGVGWRRNFRNPDDSYRYQDIWMGSAFAILRYADHMDLSKSPGLRYAVDWVKYQVPLSVYPLDYGLPSPARPLDTLAIGAFILKDGECRWLLDQELYSLRKAGEPLPDDLIALWLWDDSVKPIPFRPSSMSILGPTGYAFRPGVLEPDKLVITALSGSSHGSQEMYALANLRSSGWHRYPSTNTLTSLSIGNRRLVAEDIIAKHYSWMPAGRAVHRDLKVDRERLNGLLVQATGLDALITGITGIYSPWRQDVPPFARVTLLKQVGDIQLAKIITKGWNGIAQERFYIEEGASRFIVIDNIRDNRDREKAIAWHLVNFKYTAPLSFIKHEPETKDVALTLVNDPGVETEVQPIDNRNPPAYPDAAPNLKILVKSSALYFGTAAIFCVRDQQCRNPERAAFSDNKDGLISLKWPTEDGQDFLIIGNGRKWQSEGVSSDAQILRLKESTKETTVTIGDGSFFNMQKVKQFTSITWNGKVLDGTSLLQHGRSIVFDNGKPANGELVFRK